MSDLTLKMVMSLVDTASPTLTSFVALVESLGPKVTGLANRFTTLERNIAKVGTASETNASKIEKVDKSFSGLDSTVKSVESILGTLPKVLSTVVAALDTVSRAAVQSATDMGMLSSASRSVSGSVAGATGSLQSMGNVVNGVTKQVTTLHGVMEGLAAQWASMKIFQAGEASVNEASEFQLAQRKIAALNFPVAQNAEIEKDAASLSKRLGISVREGLEAYMSAIAGLAVTDYDESKKEISATLDDAIKTAIILRLRGDTSSIKDITRNLYGLIEARGQVADPEAAKRTMEIIQKNNTATGGKLTTKDLETISRQMKAGYGVQASDDGLLYTLAFANQLKASGSGGGGGGMGVSQAGTATTQVYKWATAGIINKESIRALEAMGLVDRGVAKGDSSTTDDNIPPGAIKGSDKAISNPIGFLMDMAPYALALAMKNKEMFFGDKSTDDPTAINEALAKVALILFKNVNQANMAVQAWVPGSAARMVHEVEQTKNSKPTDAALKDVDDTYQRNIEKFDAAVKTFQVTVGTNLLPILTPVIEGLTSFLGFLGEIANANPTATTLTSIALAIGAVGMSLFALQKMFGVFSILTGLLGGFRGAATATGAATAGASAAVTGFGGVLNSLVGWLGTALKWLGRGLGIVGALILLYDVLVMVFDVKIWGVSIGTWFASFVDGILTGMTNLKISMMEILGLMTEGEAKKAKAQNNASRVAAQVANGIPTGTTDKEKDDTNARIAPVAVVAKKEYEKKEAAENEGKSKHEEELSREQKFRNKMIEDAKKLTVGKYDGKKKDVGYNEAAGEDQQQQRVDESKMRGDLKVLEAEKRAHLMSDSDYFDEKAKIINTGYDKIIAGIESKKSKLRANEVQARQRADADIEIKQNERSSALEQLAADKERASSEYKQSMSKVQGLLDEAEGKRHEARLEKLKQELILLREKAVLNGTPEDVENIDKAISITDSTIAFEGVYHSYEKINNKVVQQIDLINAKVAAGLMTETEAAHAKWDLRRMEAVQLEGIIAQLETLAEATGDEKLVQKIALLKIQMGGLSSALSPDAVKLKNILEGSFGNFFTDILQKNKSLKDSFRDLFSSLERGVMDMVSKQLSQQLFNSIFGGSGGSGMLGSITGGGGGMGGGGGFMGSIIGGIMGMFGGGDAPALAGTAITSGGGDFMSGLMGMGGGAGSVLGGGGDMFSSIFTMGSFAVGTNSVPFDMLAKIHKDEIIVPAAQRDSAIALWAAGSSGSGGQSVTNHFTISGPVDKRTQMQIAAAASQSIQNANRNL